MSLSLWNDPYNELRNLQRDMDRMFGSVLLPTSESGIEGQLRRWMPSFDVKESDKEILVRADLPGVKKDDIKIELNNGFLTISGERKEEKKEENEKYYRHERVYGSFSRSFGVPTNVTEDQIKARCENGVLEVAFPKQDLPKPKNIPVN